MSHWASGRNWGPRRVRKRAAVLGCGPAGLFAVHGLKQAGWNVSILSNRKKSSMYGAQYLHAPIPGLTPEDEKPEPIEYRLTGDVDGYREKVYGSTPVKVSPQSLSSRHDSWDIRAAYDAAWGLYGETVQDLEITPRLLGMEKFDPGNLPDPSDVLIDWRQFDTVISTIPMTKLCYQEDLHQFHSTQIWAVGDAPDRGQYAPFRPEPNVVECNGTREVGWYRAANIRGQVTVEWPGRSKPPLPYAAPVYKPIYTTCDCYRDGRFPVRFIPAGRYGAWSKGVLAHHAYTQAANL